MKIYAYSPYSFNRISLSQIIHSGFKQHIGLWAGAMLLMFGLTSFPAEAMVLYGCKKNNNGQLRLVPGPGACNNSETFVTWNAEGLQGGQGPQGIQGIQGVQGPKGDKGDTGSIGATGATGPQGEQGPQGVAGNDGADGVDGADGLPGIDGLDGEQGPAGPSGIVRIYRVSVIPGFIGRKYFGSATCEAGDMLIGGGFYNGFLADTEAGEFIISQNGPASDERWRFLGEDLTGSSDGRDAMSVTAICVELSP